MRSSSTQYVHRTITAAVLTLAVASGCAKTPSTTDMADQNVKLASRAIDEMWQQKNFANVKEFYAADYVSYTNGVRDTVGVEASVRGILAQYPDTRLTVGDVFGTADRVSMAWTWSATDPNSRKPITMNGVSVMQLADGKITEAHDYYDVLGPMIAAGATFTPPAAPAAPKSK